MKKSLVISFVFIVLALVSIPIAVIKIDSGKDRITITEETIRGNPAAAADVTLQIHTHWDGHLLWDTEYTADGGKDAKSDFSFSSKKVSWGIQGNPGAKLSFQSAGSFTRELSNADVVSEEVEFSEIIQAVVDRMGESDSRTETVRIADYYRNYPLIFEISRHSTRYMGYYNEACKYLTEYFHIPVLNDRLEVTIKRNKKYGTLSIDGKIIMEGRNIVISDTCAIGRNGIYYTYCLADTETGKGLDRGQKTGIFYFPIEEDNGFWNIDLTKVEKLCELPYHVVPLRMIADEEKKMLFLLADTEEEYQFLIYRLSDQEIILEQQFPVLRDQELAGDDTIRVSMENTFFEMDESMEVGNLSPYPCQVSMKDGGILVTWSNGGFSFLAEENGEYRLWCEAKFPDTGEGEEYGWMPFPRENTWIFDRDRLVLAAFENWYSMDAVLAVYRDGKEAYVGRYQYSMGDMTQYDTRSQILLQGARIWMPHSERYWSGGDNIVNPLELTVESSGL